MKKENIWKVWTFFYTELIKIYNFKHILSLHRLGNQIFQKENPQISPCYQTPALAIRVGKLSI